MKYVSLSQAIKSAADLNTPPSDYFNNFLPAYKAYHKRQNVRRTIFKTISLASIFVAASLIHIIINNNNELDISTATGVEMSNHHIQHDKVIVFEGDVYEVTKYVREHINEKTDTISLREYFNGDDVWGIYVIGDEKFRLYYQFIGNGRYTIFKYNEQ